MKIQPLFDRVLLKPIESKENRASGLILPESTSERPRLGVVVALGDGGEIDGKETKMYVKKDDVALFSRYGGIDVKIDDTDYVIVRQTDILAIMEEN